MVIRRTPVLLFGSSFETLSSPMETAHFCSLAIRERESKNSGTAKNRPSKFISKLTATKGSTSRYGCKRLVWYEDHFDIRDASAREKSLKKWSRARKSPSLRR